LARGTPRLQAGGLLGKNPAYKEANYAGKTLAAGRAQAPRTEGTAAKPGKEVSLTREVRG